MGAIGATAAIWLLWQIVSPTALLVRYAAFGNVTAVQRLLGLGADPNAYYGRSSAFLMAAREGHVPIMTLLLKQRADPMRCEKEGSAPRLSALSLAAAFGRVEAIEYLVHIGVPVEYQCGAGWPTALEMAAQQGRRTAAAKLIALRADPGRLGTGNHTYVMHAAWSANHSRHSLEIASTIELLIDSGSDVNSRLPDGRTALMMTRVPPVVATLLRKGADPNFTDCKGETALMKVIEDAVWKHQNPSSSTTYQTEALRLLLNAGADPNRRSLTGDTPLRLASRSGPYRAKIESTLRAFGARE
jgi:ankyrin repeat protein